MVGFASNVNSGSFAKKQKKLETPENRGRRTAPTFTAWKRDFVLGGVYMQKAGLDRLSIQNTDYWHNIFSDAEPLYYSHMGSLSQGDGQSLDTFLGELIPSVAGAAMFDGTDYYSSLEEALSQAAPTVEEYQDFLKELKPFEQRLGVLYDNYIKKDSGISVYFWPTPGNFARKRRQRTEREVWVRDFMRDVIRILGRDGEEGVKDYLSTLEAKFKQEAEQAKKEK